jgi:hypothetical protein
MGIGCAGSCRELRVNYCVGRILWLVLANKENGVGREYSALISWRYGDANNRTRKQQEFEET